MLVIALFAATVAIDWKPGPPLPRGLGGHVAIVENDRIVVIGGTSWEGDKKSWHDEIWRLEDGAWTRAGKLPMPLAYPAVARGNGETFFIGGWSDHGASKQMLRYANGKAELSAIALPAPRCLAGGAMVGDSIYVVGGVTDGTNFATATADCLRLDKSLGATNWKPIAPLPSPRGLAATVTCGGRIYLFGGMSAASKDLDEAIVYDPAKNSWSPLAKLPGARRGAAAVAIDDHTILIVGGCRNESGGPVFLDQALIYDTKSDAYTPASPLPLAAANMEIVLADGKIYVIGGEDRSRHRSDRVVVGKIPAAGE